MKGRDTVMSFERIQEIDLKNAESNFTDALMDVAREQAEISFKAGQEDVMRLILPYFQVIAKDNYKAGINKVIEWIKEYEDKELLSDDNDNPIAVYMFNQIHLQAKLKEWGVE